MRAVLFLSHPVLGLFLTLAKTAKLGSKFPSHLSFRARSSGRVLPERFLNASGLHSCASDRWKRGRKRCAISMSLRSVYTARVEASRFSAGRSSAPQPRAIEERASEMI